MSWIIKTYHERYLVSANVDASIFYWSPPLNHSDSTVSAGKGMFVWSHKPGSAHPFKNNAAAEAIAFLADGEVMQST